MYFPDIFVKQKCCLDLTKSWGWLEYMYVTKYVTNDILKITGLMPIGNYMYTYCDITEYFVKIHQYKLFFFTRAVFNIKFPPISTWLRLWHVWLCNDWYSQKVTNFSKRLILEW